MKKLLKVIFEGVIGILLMPLFSMAATINVIDEESLKIALTDISEDTIINVMNDIEIKSKVQITGKSSLTINGNDKKVYAASNNTDRIFELTASDEILDVTFKHITIKNTFWSGTLTGGVMRVPTTLY